MIQNNHITEIVTNLIDRTDLFIVDISVKPGNKITILADSIQGITIDECAALSRSVDSILTQNKDDFELEVSSPGLTLPFKVKQQYYKNLGRDVEVLLNNGQKFEGKLLSLNDDFFTVELQRKHKPEGKKKPEIIIEKQNYKFDEVKSTKIVINF